MIAVHHPWPNLDEGRADGWRDYLEAGGKMGRYERLRLETFTTQESPRIKAIGQSAQWSLAIEVVGNPACQVCNGRQLGTSWTCLACLRSGMDDILPTVPRNQRPKAYHPDPDGLAGGRGRKRRAG